MDLFEIGNINKYVLLILMVTIIAYVYNLNRLNDKRNNIARLELDVKMLEKDLKEKQIIEQSIVNQIRKKQLEKD